MLKHFAKFSTLFITVMFFCTGAFGIGDNDYVDVPVNIVTGWDAGGDANANSVSYSNYLLAGQKMTMPYKDIGGTHSDEDATVVNMARKINDKGGYFCPTQIQYACKNEYERICMNLYEVYNSAPCRWICKPGYKGENCATPDNGDECDAGFDMTSLSKATLNTGTKRKDIMDKNATDVFYVKTHCTSSSHDRYADVVVLAILAYYKHGVLVGRLDVEGIRNGAKGEVHTWLNKVQPSNERFLLCDTGFKPNDKHTDCVPINEEVCADFCSGWDKTKYNSSNHVREIVDGCAQWRCKDESLGLTAKGSSECKKCDSGKAVSKKTGMCATAIVISKDRMLYGKYGNAVITPLEQQCWTKTDPTEYYDCVMKENQPETSEPADTADNADTQE